MTDIKNTKNKSLKILLAASEVVPFAKTGGLADVAGALPKALKKLGHDVRVVMPRYKPIDEDKFSIHKTGLSFDVDIALFKHAAEIKETVFPNTDIPVYFVDNTEFFYRDELYRTPQGEYWDNAERFMFFSKAVMEMIRIMDFKPDVIHCNDWHTGLVPVFLKNFYNTIDFYKDIGTVYSIHNIAYQGVYGSEILSHAGLPASLFSMDKMEFYGSVNFMKGGMVFADIINTVSNKYREEIQTPEFGWGLDGVLQSRKNDLYGVVNGIDYSIWDPALDKYIPVNYAPDTIQVKQTIKKKLLEENGLKFSENVPLIGLISRLDDQKGLDFIAAIIDDMMKMNLQFIVLGTGEEKYHKLLTEHRQAFPEKMAVNIKFDNKLAHNIYAGCDMFLMPSHFEPCGLGQLISLKYGTVPVVRETGGLADTVKQYNFKEKTGNGFVFSGFDPQDLLQAIRIAVDTFKNKTAWKKLMMNGMKENFSWEHAAGEYVEIYKKAMEKS